MSVVQIHIGGPAVPKQSAQFFRIPGGHTQARQPAKVKRYEAYVLACAQRAMGDTPPFTGPVTLRICFNMQMPKAWSKTKRVEALSHVVLPTKRPDLDNLCKAILDGFGGTLYKDDSQITDLIVTKRYASEPSVDVTARAIDPKDLLDQRLARDA